jgi:hypothetical protein
MAALNDYIAEHRPRMVAYLDMISVCRRNAVPSSHK